MSIYLSASSIADFIQCSQKVLYRRTKPFPELKSKDMILGSILHSALEKGWNNRERAYSIIRSEAKAEGLLKSDVVNLEFKVDLFFLNFAHLVGPDDLIEYNFKLALYDDVFIVGKMDRISGGNVLDWKSGKVSSRLGGDVQCIIYDYAFRNIFGKTPNSICLASLSTGDLVPYVEDKLCVREVFDNAIPNMIRTIKNNTYWRMGLFNHACFRCPFKVGCLGSGGVDNYVMDSGVTPE